MEVERRIGDVISLPQIMRAGLSRLAGCGGMQQVGMGGVFKVESGQVKAHLMPAFEACPEGYYDAQLGACTKDFLQFYHGLGPDLVCMSCLWTGDPTGGQLNLRPSGEHTHFYSSVGKSEGGHYHGDVTPEEIRYVGYFSLASEIYRVGDAYKEAGITLQ